MYSSMAFYFLVLVPVVHEYLIERGFDSSAEIVLCRELHKLILTVVGRVNMIFYVHSLLLNQNVDR
jgi:predicted amidophosphoribosyltransferase